MRTSAVDVMKAANRRRNKLLVVVLVFWLLLMVGGTFVRLMMRLLMKPVSIRDKSVVLVRELPCVLFAALSMLFIAMSRQRGEAALLLILSILLRIMSMAVGIDIKLVELGSVR